MKYVKDFIVFVFLILILCYGKETLATSKEALTLWFEKLVPSMFVTLVLIRILYHRQILKLLKLPFFNRLLRVDSAVFSLILCTMFLGFPNGALFIDDAYHKGILTKEGAKRLLYTCSFAAPGFVIMTCGALLFHSIEIGIQLFVAQILSGLCLLICTRFLPIITDEKKQEPVYSLMKSMNHSILESGKALYMMGGYLMLFMSITSVLLQFLPTFLALPLRIIAEFSSGIILLQTLPFSSLTLQLLTCMLLSFGGLCVHMQVHSMAEHISFSYFVYFFFRLAQSILSLLIYCLFLL